MCLSWGNYLQAICHSSLWRVILGRRTVVRIGSLLRNYPAWFCTPDLFFRNVTSRKRERIPIPTMRQ